MSEEPSIPQEEVTYHLYEDELQKSRTLSDAELLSNGAEYRKGVLTPTEQQIEDLKQTEEKRHTQFAMEDAAKDARKILFNEQEAEAFAPMSEVIAHREKLEELRTDIQSALAPYEGIFLGEIPLRDRDDPPKLGKQLEREWKIETNHEGIEAVALFDLKYTPDQYGDRLDQVDMAIVSKEYFSESTKKRLFPGFTFSYEAGELTKISDLNSLAGWETMMLNVHRGINMFDLYGKSHSEGKWTQGNPNPETSLQKFAKLFVTCAVYGGRTEINLSAENPRVTFTKRAYNEKGRFTGYEVANEYTYDSEEDTFVLSTNKDGRTRAPKVLSKQDFLDFMKAPLELIPTMEY